LGYARGISDKIVLIDGEALTQYMIEFDLGVLTANACPVKKVDADYFAEE
jgi:restriction system protein